MTATNATAFERISDQLTGAQLAGMEQEIDRRYKEQLNIARENIASQAIHDYENSRNWLSELHAVEMQKILDDSGELLQRAIEVRDIWAVWMRDAILYLKPETEIARNAKGYQYAQQIVINASKLNELGKDSRKNVGIGGQFSFFLNIATQIHPAYTAYTSAKKQLADLTGEGK